MSNKHLQFNSRARILLTWLGLFSTLFACAVTANFFANKASIEHAIDTVEHRIILDSAFLDVGSKTLDTPVNQYAVTRYIERLNKVLQTREIPVIVLSIQNVAVPVDVDVYPSLHTEVFNNAEQTISMKIRSKTSFQELHFSWLALGLSFLLIPLFSLADKKQVRTRSMEEAASPPKPKLIINLQDKTLSNGIDDKVVTLQNKPLCFYTALVKYCIEHPGEPLPPHKDVPPELLALANKSFGRLIELGHTKRKRPDFNANLDKTLSEIRAALDEVFSSFSEEKEKYYPPRAQGEGSRSKQHSYAIPSIKQEDITIIGN
ncbi:hypothetical protein [Alteromonas gracilis]|uniref:hypothetical protein n=1 Tax=Alteromonas gracilis TaxID=1479524 RepID=UPI002FE10A63